MSRIFLSLTCAVLAGAVPSLAEQAQPVRDKPKAAEELLDAFSTAKYFWQQGDTARELIALGDTNIIARMEKYLDPWDRRRLCNAAWVMASLGDHRGVAIIIGQLEDTKPRPTTMTRSDGKPYPEGQITADRYYAAHLLGQFRDKAAVPALIRATRDETIAYRAAISLGEIGDKSAIPALREMAKTAPDQFNRIWAAYGLAALGDAEGFDILQEVIGFEPRWDLRRHAVEALGKAGNPKALPTLLKALKDPHVNVRVSAARALSVIRDPAAVPALTEALNGTEVTQINAPTTVAAEARIAIAAIQSNRK